MIGNPQWLRTTGLKSFNLGTKQAVLNSMRKSSLLCGTGGMGKEVRHHVEDRVFLRQNVLDKANAICEVCLGLYLYFIYIVINMAIKGHLGRKGFIT